MYTIGDIAKQYHITADALRYYEEKGLITPQRSKSGYRLYSDQDIWRINVIEELRDLQFPVERIREYLNDGTIEATTKILNEELEVVSRQQARLASIRSHIEQGLQNIRDSKALVMEEITIKHFPDRPATLLQKSFSRDEEMDKLMKTLAEDGKAPHIIGNSRIAAVLASFSSEEIYSGAFMFEENGGYLLPEGNYLSICYSGEWASRAHAEKLIDYAKKHDLILDDTFFDIVWIDTHTAIRMSDHISEVQVRIL